MGFSTYLRQVFHFGQVPMIGKVAHAVTFFYSYLFPILQFKLSLTRVLTFQELCRGTHGDCSDDEQFYDSA